MSLNASNRHTQFLEPAPYQVLKRQVSALASLTNEERSAILALAATTSLAVVDFDSEWYLSAYPDVKAAISAGDFNSAEHHYILLGYFEGRLPRDIDFDEEFYLKAYSDVKRALETGQISSPKLHFLTKGYGENRSPSAKYTFYRPTAFEVISAARKHVTK